MKNNMKELRKAAHLTQRQLANLCGVTTETINRIEKGSRNPSLQLAYNIAFWIEPSSQDVNKVFCLQQT